MGRPFMTEEQIKEMKIKLIHATQEIMEESGFENVSIRNIGQRLGINSATIYRYFHNLDELTMFACVDELQKYTIELTATEVKLGDTYNEEFYLLSWKLFCKHAFRSPRRFQRLFFSKYSSNLSDIIVEYYKLFPNTLTTLPINQKEMLIASNLLHRNLYILEPLINGKPGADLDSRISTVNELTVSYFYSLLMEKVARDVEINNDTQTERMLTACRYLLHTA